MVEQKETNILACPMQSREPIKVSEDVVRKVGLNCVKENDRKPSCVMVKWHIVVHRYQFPPMVKSFTNFDAVNWMRHGGFGRGFLITAVGFAALVALTLVIALALLFVSSTLNVAFAIFLVAFLTVCFIMAFSTVVYMGALGFGGLTIGSIAFFSV